MDPDLLRTAAEHGLMGIVLCILLGVVVRYMLEGLKDLSEAKSNIAGVKAAMDKNNDLMRELINEQRRANGDAERRTRDERPT